MDVVVLATFSFGMAAWSSIYASKWWMWLISAAIAALNLRMVIDAVKAH